MFKRIITGLISSLIFILIIGCCPKEKAKIISTEKIEPLKIETAKEKPLCIAIGSSIILMEEFVYHKQLLDYIEQKLEIPIKILVKESYAEINKLMGLGDVDVAFMSGKAYVDGYDDYKIQLLVVPKINGKTDYYSYLIVPKDSPVKNLRELRDKNFAFVDQMSNTGMLYPHFKLTEMGEKPDYFFKKYIYTYSHDKSIKMVSQKIVDGASVSSIVWEHINQISPEITSKTKIIEKSPPFGIPPICVRPDLKKETKEKLKNIFLNIHKDEKGREILKRMKIEKYVLIDKKAYDSIWKMKLWIIE